MAISALTGLIISAGLSAGASLFSSSQQRKADRETVRLERQQAKQAGADVAAVAARDFRRDMSSQLAISSLRGGSGGSLVRQFGAESMANFLQDQGVLENRAKFVDLSADRRNQQAGAANFGRIASTTTSFLTKLEDAFNFNSKSKSE